MGETGAGTVTKLVYNLMSAVQTVALAEGLALAESAGLSLEQVISVIMSGGPSNPLMGRNAPLMAAHHYGETQFALHTIRKDVLYALSLADELGASLATGSAALGVYRIAEELGYDDAEFAAVFEAVCKCPRSTAKNFGSY